MSSVDPLAALAAQAAAIQSGTSDASLDLGAVAQALQAQLSAGDVLEALILPAQGGQDLLEILGQTVVAQLPPDVHPGDVLLLQVTGFQGNQILVRNLGTQDPNNPVPTFVPQLSPQEIQGSSAAATLTTIVGDGAKAAPPQVPTPQSPVPVEIPQSNGPPIAPPASVFVAAAVRPSPALAQPASGQAPAPPSQSAPAQQAPAQQAPAQSAPPPPPSAPLDVESRLAATRATMAERAVQTPAPVTARNAQPPSPQQAPAATSAPSQPQTRPINLPVAPPLITRSSAASPHVSQAQTRTVPPAAQAPAQSTGAAPAQAASAQAASAQAVTRQSIPVQATRAQAATPQATSAQSHSSGPVASRDAVPARALPIAAQLADAVASKEPVRILAALRVPATPVTLAAARVVTTAATQVQSALQNLEQVLSRVQSSDARVATLTTLTSFISNLQPRDAPVLAAQLSAFAGNVVAGAESKLSQLLHALSRRDVQSATPATPETPAVPVQHDAGTAPAHVPVLAQARAAERQMALTQDLKSTLLSLAASPPAGGSPQLMQAVNESLVALTAMQFNSLIATQQDPSTIAMSVPLVFYDGGHASNIRVSRDNPDKKSQRLDADNFHIAFVLDTQALGTVAIDLETVGRAVSVAVKTDRASAVERFKHSLGDLRARLEHLRYSVKSTGADMVSAPATENAPAAASKTPNVDLQA